MSTRKGPAARIKELLADGEWYERQQLIARCVHLIRPEVAVRTYKAKAAGRYKVKADMETSVRYGKRWAVQSSILQLLRTGKIERRDKDGLVYFRRTK